MKFRIGDKVKISKKKALCLNNILPTWYSDQVFTVKEVDKQYKVVTLDKILLVDNKINICYLKSLKKERKKKLLKLNSLYNMG
jgi:hypothetical protein